MERDPAERSARPEGLRLPIDATAAYILVMQLGSEAHKQLFCTTFLETHRPLDPASLPWPDLAPDDLARLHRLPFWGEALATERATGATISAYARIVSDPLLAEAIAVQGLEEMRHARLLETLMEPYHVQATVRSPEPLPADLERGFVDTGYGECIDSFFAFGLFAVARRSGLFPGPLCALMEPVVAEEARHIVFFANWEAYRQVKRRPRVIARRRIRALRFYLRAVRRRVEAFRSASGGGFTARGASAVTSDFDPAVFLATCLAENERRLEVFDPRLARPQLVPRLARLALAVLRLRRRSDVRTPSPSR